MTFASVFAILRGADRLGPGHPAPDFEVEDTEGHTHALRAMLENGPVVLAFFPSAFTPG